MQTYLPLIKSILSQWYLFTLNNVMYATVLAIAVWLLTAMFYSIRIAAIKRGKIASEKAGIENLKAVQQQLQHSQEELAESALQMEKAKCAVQDESQRALALEQLTYQRNQQIAGIIQTLATSFDLGERPLLAGEDVKADLLWQQHDKAITQLTERLRTELQAKIELQQTYQAEKAILAEKETLLKTLQTTLDNHTSQLSKLGQALEEQKSMLQQQTNTQQALSDVLKKHQPDMTQPAEPEQEPIKPVNTWQQPMQMEESPVIEDILIAQPVLDNPIEEVNEELQAQAAIPSQDEETPIELVTTDEVAAPVPSDINPQSTAEEAASVSSDMEQQPANLPKGSLGKIKNLFGKSKQQSIKTEPKWAVTKSDGKEAPSLPSDAELQSDNEISGKAKKQGKLKGLYSKLTSKAK